MRILPMSAEHIDAVAALERVCFSTPWSATSLREELDNPCAVFAVAVGEDGALLGYVGMHHLVDEGFITNVAVAPSARRQGVAQALLRHLSDYGAAHGLYRITLEVRVSNAPAIALYEGFGFQILGRRPKYYVNPVEDAYIMGKELS